MTQDHLWNYEEAAKYLGVSVGNLRQKVCRKEIPHIRFSPRFVRFDPTALKVWIHKNQTTPLRSGSLQEFILEATKNIVDYAVSNTEPLELTAKKLHALVDMAERVFNDLH